MKRCIFILLFSTGLFAQEYTKEDRIKDMQVMAKAMSQIETGFFYNTILRSLQIQGLLQHQRHLLSFRTTANYKLLKRTNDGFTSCFSKLVYCLPTDMYCDWKRAFTAALPSGSATLVV